MNEQDFWQIIETAGSPDTLTPDDQCDAIAAALAKKSKDEIIAFHNLHREILNRAYTWDLIEACFIVLHYVSDDVFEDFRNWIILNGKSRFEQAIENPDFLASFMNVKDPVEEVTGEPLLYVYEDAFDGDIEELETHFIYPDEPELEDNWPPVEELKQKYPKLFEQYWDNTLEYEFDAEEEPESQQ